jgi:hypothetical protein
MTTVTVLAPKVTMMTSRDVHALFARAEEDIKRLLGITPDSKFYLYRLIAEYSVGIVKEEAK